MRRLYDGPSWLHAAGAQTFQAIDTIQRGNGTLAQGDYTTIMLDRTSTSPCDDRVVTSILLGERGTPAPTLLLPYLNQRVAVRGRVICPGSGIQFAPQPDDVFPVW